MSDVLYDAALKAIQKVHTDRSVPAKETSTSLANLRDEIETMLEGLAFDIKQVDPD